jgi:hypothetical protein
MIVAGAPIVLIPVVLLGRHMLMDYLPFYVAFTVEYFSHLLMGKDRGRSSDIRLIGKSTLLFAIRPFGLTQK